MLGDRKGIMHAVTADITLGVCGNAITCRDGVWYTHHSFGRIVELLLPHVGRLRYFAPQAVAAAAENCDYPLAGDNISVHPWPPRRNSLAALKRPDRLLRQYWQAVRPSDALFLRGSGPLIWTVHWMARLRGLRVVHWVVTNPPVIMAGEQRGYGTFVQALGIQFARFEQLMTRWAIRVSRAHVLANGAELATIFQSKRTVQVVSTSITEADFLVRDDTCLGDSIRILFVGFIRPEKGLEYLIRALPRVETAKPVRLALVGPSDQFAGERKRLEGIVLELGLTDHVSWEGYAAFGRDLFDQMDRSDVLVLPSVSEGTPRVLVEARARSLPVISTTVGGIPSSVTDGEDGLLVPPCNVGALARALSSVIDDGDLRRRLIDRGRERVSGLTVGRFAALVMQQLTDSSASSAGQEG